MQKQPEQIPDPLHPLQLDDLPGDIPTRFLRPILKRALAKVLARPEWRKLKKPEPEQPKSKLPGGHSVIVAAGAVVTKDVPVGVIAKGNPARW